MRSVAQLAIAQLALSKGEWATVKSALDDISSATAPKVTSQGQGQVQGREQGSDDSMQPPRPLEGQHAGVNLSSEVLPPALTIQLLLVEALYHAHMGNVKIAKDKLKAAHQLLDAPESNDDRGRGEKEGWVRVNHTFSREMTVLYFTLMLCASLD